MDSRYEIRVKGILDGRWAIWFEDLQVASDGEETVISGAVADQAALHGLLAKVRDLRAVPDLGTPPRSRLTIAPGRPPGLRAETREALMHPATPIKNSDQVRKESGK